MAYSLYVYSDFFSRYDVVQHVALTHGKNILIDCLRHVFRQDSVYPYRDDQYGFPIVPDHTGIPNEDAGTEHTADGTDISSGDLATKIIITDIYRQDVKFYPVVTIKQSSGRDHKISFNQNAECLNYRYDIVRDAYGNEIATNIPTHYLFAGAWDQTFEIKIVANSHTDRCEITDIILMALNNVLRADLIRNGLLIKNISMNGEQEEEYGNDHIYISSLGVETYSEWRREIPVFNVIDRINFYIDLSLSGINPRASSMLPNGNSSSSLIAIIP